MSIVDDASRAAPPLYRLVVRTGHPDFLDLPWERPLQKWKLARIVQVQRGIGRHVVRFVDYDGALYALKELPPRLAQREYRLLRRLAEAGQPAVEPVGVVSERSGSEEAVLITRYLDYSLPYRLVLQRKVLPASLPSLLDAFAQLLVRLHVLGFFWGDCSLSNTLFRRDAGALSAYLVDAETGELHDALSDGQREHDLLIAKENVAGELVDLALEAGLEEQRDPDEVADDVLARYRRVWDEISEEETFAPEERFRLDEHLHRLNELGFDVEEIELVRTDEGYRLRVQSQVVEPGHHRRRLLALTGLRAQENQARRLLRDIDDFGKELEKEGAPAVSAQALAGAWLYEVFEPAIAAIPKDLWGKREAAELYHELLEHRWFLSEQAGVDVGRKEALRSYIEQLRSLPDERRAAMGNGA
jgi:tRNA A-37 threonylcarbamoyl transferase component Bud32